ncbi:MAG: polysaccharide deacetylase family protein, partial [Nocardioidaceae bacterium]
MRSRAWFATAAVCAVLTTSACSGGGTSSVGAAAQAGAPAAVTTTTAPCTVPARLAGKDLTRLPVTGKLVALTFDAGANAAGVPSILKTLHDKKVRATFFLTGRFVKTFPKKSAHIGADYLVGNHTVSHPDLTTLTDRQVRAEVRTAQQQILAATGQDPRRFFRFPFGARNAHTIALLNSLC